LYNNTAKLIEFNKEVVQAGAQLPIWMVENPPAFHRVRFGAHVDKRQQKFGGQ
jgi:hypothetical protein